MPSVNKSRPIVSYYYKQVLPQLCSLKLLTQRTKAWFLVKQHTSGCGTDSIAFDHHDAPLPLLVEEPLQ